MTHSTNPFIAVEDRSDSSGFAAGFSAPPIARAGDESALAPSYAIGRSGPALRSEEVELADVPAIEVIVCWGNSVLHVAHLNPPRAFFVGETASAAQPCDCLVPSERLGVTRLPLLMGSPGALSLVIPAEATGYVRRQGEAVRSIEAVRAEAEALVELPGARALPFVRGMRARLELAGFVFYVASVRAGRPTGRGVAAFDWSSAPYFGLSLVVHASLLGALAFFTPSLGLADEESLDRDRLYLMQQYLASAAERENERADAVAQSPEQQPDGGTGARAMGPEGSLGNPTVQTRSKRYGVAGPKDNPDPALPREAALREAMSFGMLGLLNDARSMNAPSAPWGRDTALGTDEISAQGNMWGDDIGDAFGAGGLSLSGLGEGGGGRGEGIGLGDIGLGHGAGLGTADGFGNGAGRLRGTRSPKAPSLIRLGKVEASGRLPPEVIQRVVRQNFGRFRLCYTQGLSRNPNLEGRVTARFVIGRDGAVHSVTNGGSDMPDSGVTSCVLSAFYGLSFPQPENGIVTVVYPIMLSPG